MRRGLVVSRLLLGFSLGVACWCPTRVWAADEPAASGSDEKAADAPKTEEDTKLDLARKQVDQLNYTDARQVLFGIVESGKATSEQLSKAYFTLGEVEAGLGNEVESTDSFYLSLMIKPATVFPPGGSPKIRERLNEARSRLTEVGVLEASASVHAGVLDVYIANDPLQLVKSVDVTMTRGGGDVGKAKLPLNALRAQVDADVQTIRVELRDDSGNELKGIDVDPTVQNGPKPGQAFVRPSLWSNWGLWAGVAGALALSGTYFIVEAGKLNSDAEAERKSDTPEPSRVRELQNRRDRVGTYGVVGLGMAGGAALTSGLLLFLHHDSSAPKKDAGAGSEAKLVPNFGPTQIGADFSLNF
jgi:hypothetical protein